MTTKHVFVIGWHDGDAPTTLYASDAEHAKEERRKCTYSATPIRFIKLFSAVGEEVRINLAWVAAVTYKTVEDDEPGGQPG
jgi:hypothetical protein